MKSQSKFIFLVWAGLCVSLAIPSATFAQGSSGNTQEQSKQAQKDAKKEEKAAKKEQRRKKKSIDATKVDDQDDIGNLKISGIDVVQNRVFVKSGRSEFTFGVGAILDNPFLRYQMAQFRYTYHIRETFGIELSYQRAFSQQKALVGQLEGIECAPGEFFDEDGNDLANVPGACGVTFTSPPDPYENIYVANFIWSPIYGKFSIFSKKIYHFDLFLTAGVGYYDTERDGYVGFNAGIGGKIYFNEWFAFRADLRNLTIKEGAPFNNVVNNRIISAGFSFYLPTNPNRDK